MANLLSIARPYAFAAFEFARDKGQLPAWKTFLSLGAEAARQTKVISLLMNPEFSAASAFDLFNEILTSFMTEEQKNFLKLLSQNKRLLLLPDILTLFNQLEAALQKISTVKVITAVAVTEDYKQTLKSALTKRIQREVTLDCEVNPAILGGAVIHIGDNVIDGSIHGKLTRLLNNLTG